MSLFLDVIEWTEPADSQLLAYRFPVRGNEINYGAKLTVREGQAAVFVNQGKLADVFQPGMYGLSAPNLPILSTLLSWPYGFSSPYKAEVYFISTRRWTDQKWGTQNPIMLRDPEFGPVRVRAFGTFAIQVSDPKTFLQQLIGTDPSFETFDITGQLRSMIVSHFTDALGRLKVGVLDLAGNYAKVAAECQARMNDEFANMGLKLVSFVIENISLPEDVEKAIDTRTKMGVIGDMSQYTKYQAANAIGDAAANPGGLGGIGAQLAAGVAVGGQMAGALGAGLSAPTSPPPMPATVAYFAGIGGKQEGPFTAEELRSRIAAGAIKRDTLVWKSGMPA
ncbi:MAG: SPFH domain-containing protein [Gemmataceae bacterium]|nr:SPFH domain-containing protein [Gemmataceae bacterium]